jgi:cytochrome c biogenesis protein CcmG/thiol:disulfide interchange protein DsbE
VVIAAVALMIFAGVHWSRRTQQGAALPTTGPVVGALAPDFELQSVDGRTVKLSDLRGNAAVVNFWATWCQPCKLEMPWFEELHQKYKEQGLEMIGINTDDYISSKDSVRDEVAKFAKELGVTYTILRGKESVVDAYGGAQFLPTTFYVDRQGKVVANVAGITGKDEIEGNIKKALSAPAGQSQRGNAGR